MEQNNSKLASLLLVVIAIWFVIALLWSLISSKEERDFIKMEIERSTTEKERKHWEKALRRLNISCIPVIGYLLLGDDE